MSSSSKLTFEPILCLTNSPQSSTRKSPSEQHLFFKAITLKSPEQLPFLGNPDTLVTGCVKLDSFHKHWGGGRLFKVVVTSTLLHFQKLSLLWPSFIFPFSLHPWLAFCFSNSLVPSPRMTYDLEHPITPRAPQNLLPLHVYCLSSFALRTTGCQAKAAVLSALVKESR